MADFWSVIELQTHADGAHAALVTAFDDRNAALSKYHAVLSAAAVSTIPYHAAFLLNSFNGQELCEIYNRTEA